MLAYILRLHVFQLINQIWREFELWNRTACCHSLSHCAHTLSRYLVCVSDFIVLFANFVRKRKGLTTLFNGKLKVILIYVSLISINTKMFLKNLSFGYILSIFLKVCLTQPRYSYKKDKTKRVFFSHEEQNTKETKKTHPECSTGHTKYSHIDLGSWGNWGNNSQFPCSPICNSQRWRK